MAMGGQYLEHYGLPQQLRSEEILENREYFQEFRYDTSVLIQIVTKNEVLLTDEQQFVYHQFLKSIQSVTGQVFFKCSW